MRVNMWELVHAVPTSTVSPSPDSEAGASGHSVRVLGAEDPFADRQQRGELVAGPGRIPRLPGPAGEVAAGDSVSGCSGP